MTAWIREQLIAILAEWAPQQTSWQRIELCLDPGSAPINPSTRVAVYSYGPLEADDLIVWRVDECARQDEPFMVVSGDHEVEREVRRRGGKVLHPEELVRVANRLQPILADAPRAPRIMMSKREPPSIEAIRSEKTAQIGCGQQAAGNNETVSGHYDAMIRALLLDRPIPLHQYQGDQVRRISQVERKELDRNFSQPDLGERRNENPDETKLRPEPAYRLCFENWPVNEGVRFLKDAFCDTHRKVYEEMLSAFDLATFSAQDLRALALILLEACGNESDFTRRGSTLDRARLALLQARGQALTILEIAELTRLNPSDLTKKIRRTAGKWLGEAKNSPD